MTAASFRTDAYFVESDRGGYAVFWVYEEDRAWVRECRSSFSNTVRRTVQNEIEEGAAMDLLALLERVADRNGPKATTDDMLVEAECMSEYRAAKPYRENPAMIARQNREQLQQKKPKHKFKFG